MTGEVAQNISALRSCSLEGLTAEAAADRLNIGVQYVKALAKRHAIYFPKNTSHSDIRTQQVRALAAEGLTRHEAAERLNVRYGTVVNYARLNDIQFKRRNDNPSVPTARTRQMAALYQSGCTLELIGGQFNITRERVRQIITKHHNLRAPDGGMHKCAEERRLKKEAARNALYLKRTGCNYDQYQKLRGKIVYRFNQQKRNAGTREIGWELNLWQWWSIWQQSGHWAQRGRGQGYVMCRKGDNGPYAVDNVFIAPARENSSKQARNKSGLPIGVRKNKKCAGYTAQRSVNGVTIRLGSHPTPELAHAAYLACVPQQRAA